ncbi:MAG TPA: hypothetical protein PLX97_00210, partial [Gemmatales bacterium]|nr:hypothetical protein [Gemmatales bacterium]
CYLIDVETRGLVKKLPLTIAWMAELTVDDRHFVVMEWKSEVGYEVQWLSVETGEIERSVMLPIRGGKKPEWGTQLNLKNGEVACITSFNTTLIPLATEFAKWLERKLGIKLDWKWLIETKSRAVVHLIHLDGSHEQLWLGKYVNSVNLSHDGKHLLAHYDSENGKRYALFQLPLPSPYPIGVLYGLLAALPLLLLQLVWRRMRKSPRPITAS